MRWPQWRVRRARPGRTAKSCGPGIPTLMPSFANQGSQGDGGKKARSPGRSRISRKTIAWGMPDVSGASAVNTGVHTHYQYAHTRLRVHWAPGIPRALFCEGDEMSGQPRARIARAEIATCYPKAGTELAITGPSRYPAPPFPAIFEGLIDALSPTRPQRPEGFADLPRHHDVRRADRRGDVVADHRQGTRGRHQLHRHR